MCNAVSMKKCYVSEVFPSDDGGYAPELGCKIDNVTTPPYTPEILNNTKV